MSADYIHDPEGVVIFAEPTAVPVCHGAADSEATVSVLPYSARRGDLTFWAGPDTYHLPEDAEFTIVDGASLSELEGQGDGDRDEPVPAGALFE